MASRYDKIAEKSNSIIVSACGFDCIPAEIGVLFLERQFEQVGRAYWVETFAFFSGFFQIRKINSLQKKIYK